MINIMEWVTGSTQRGKDHEGSDRSEEESLRFRENERIRRPLLTESFPNCMSKDDNGLQDRRTGEQS